MVKKMIVLLGALALMVTAAGMASAQFAALAGEGDMIMIPMKVKTTFSRSTGPGGFSTFFSRGCPIYKDFFPWGTWRAVKCEARVQVIPPKCVAPAVGGPMAWGAPPALMPGARLVSNVEKFSIKSPGCNPCVDGGLQYSIQRNQVVK